MPEDQTLDQTLEVKKKIIWVGSIVVALAVLLFAGWRIISKYAPASNEPSPETLKSLTATGTTSVPVSPQTLKDLSASGTTSPQISPQTLKDLSASGGTNNPTVH